MSTAMDDVLGRVKIAVAKGALVEAIRSEIARQLEKFDLSDHDVGKLAERLRRAIADDSRSADVGIAGRLLREFVLARILISEDIKKMTPFETMQELRKRQIAEWVICYLNLLHALGNEAVHHKTQSSYPPELESRDLAICLFAIQRVMDFWFEWGSMS